ncbi:hypothetical protein [Neobacillus endophyticus]|uniref:hypothetical protein n=1 Tax=Neobacillus endophyticus TaxID=2738405 RepID=UPI001C2567E0|nr:hypothetical protein [Neobacillus endophyticus]
MNEMIGSPRDWAVHARESARRTVLVEERKAHRITCGLLDGESSREVVEIFFNPGLFRINLDFNTLLNKSFFTPEYGHLVEDQNLNPF